MQWHTHIISETMGTSTAKISHRSTEGDNDGKEMAGGYKTGQ